MFKKLLQPLITCFKPQSMEESSSNRINPPRCGRSGHRASNAILSTATTALTAQPAIPNPPHTPGKSGKTVTFADEHAFTTLSMVFALIKRGKRQSQTTRPDHFGPRLPERTPRAEKVPAPLTSAIRQESDKGGRALVTVANHLLLTTDEADLRLTNALESVNKEMHAIVRDSNLKAVMLNAIQHACENMQPVHLPHPNAVLRAFKSEWTPEKFANPTNRSGFQSVLLQLHEAAYNAREQGDQAGCKAFERYQKELTINAPAGQAVSDARDSWDPYEKFGRAWCEAEHNIRQDNLYFDTLPEALRNDKDLLMLALQQGPTPLSHAGPDCCRDIDIMMHVAKRYPFFWVRENADASIWKELLQRCAAENIPTH